MESTVVIRPYEHRDRAAVRHICCETADRGEPLESIYSDRELAADLITRYYTDFESESAWVAENEGKIVGYATGAVDTARYQRTVLLRIIPALALRAIARGAVFRGETWRLLNALLGNLRGLRQRQSPSLRDYTAHVHVDILKPHRGKGVGKRLLAPFLEKLQQRGIRGVHATVRGDNQQGAAFFEKAGFRKVDSYDIVLPVKGIPQTVPVAVYARRLDIEISAGSP